MSSSRTLADEAARAVHPPVVLPDLLHDERHALRRQGIWHLSCCLEHQHQGHDSWECETCGCRWFWGGDWYGDFSHPSWDWLFTRKAVAV